MVDSINTNTKWPRGDLRKGLHQGLRFFTRFSLRTLIALMAIATVLVALNVERFREYWNRRGRVVPSSFNVKTGKNILWKVKVGSQSFAGPVVSGDKVFVGTNNMASYLERYPADVDLGVLLCFDTTTGHFLWQASHEKLDTGRQHDWPLQGVTTTPTVEDDRVYYVSNRGELMCVDTEGFYDDEDDGDPASSEIPSDRESAARRQEADIVWQLDMIGQLGVSPHNASCSTPCIVGNRLFVVTGHGVGFDHVKPPSTEPPSFISVDKRNGKLLWSDSSPNPNVLHGQWGSPVAGVFGGVPQVVFPGGDGWLYSFDPAGRNGKSKLLWKFDCNPKTSKWELGGRGDRNNLVGRPTIHQGRIFVMVGQDPEHGDGPGRIWCIDPTRRGDVSSELVFNKASPDVPIPHKRVQACVEDDGDFTRPNPNSAADWCYTSTDLNGDGEIDFDEEMHRGIGHIVCLGDLLFASETAGYLHCVNAKTGRAHWIHDLFARTWSSPVLSADHVLVTDEDGQFTAFGISKHRSVAMPSGQPLTESYFDSPIYGTPTITNNILYVLTRNELLAIGQPPK